MDLFFLPRVLFFLTFTGCLVSMNTDATGQNSFRQFEIARQQLARGNVVDAEKTASAILKKDSSFLDAYLFLADLYYQSDSTTLEAKILKALIRHSGKPKPLTYFRLGKALYRTGEYADALTWLEKFRLVRQDSSVWQEEIRKMEMNCRFAVEAVRNPVIFEPVRLNDEVNSPNDEYWPTISIDGKELVFTRLIKPSDSNRIPQEDFFIAREGTEGWNNVNPVSEINTAGNEGAQTLSADGRWLFFTACNRPDGNGSCDIYFSRIINEKWSQPVPVYGLINSPAWEGQPSVSSDGKILYFSSDKAGGKGGKDIWRSFAGKYTADGVPIWSDPENLGDSINTPGDEISPFIHPDGTDLYFASDYRPGMGGFDLFHARLKSDMTWTTPQNLGYPLNTIKNEQGLVINATGEIAFFSSGRTKGSGMDIYSFKVDRKYRPEPVTYIKASVVDSQTGKPLQSEVRLENLDDHSSDIFKTDTDGKIFACLPAGNNYAFQVSKAGYLFCSRTFHLKESNSSLDPLLLIIELNPIAKGQKMDLYNIYFDINSADILSESYPELEKLYGLLSDNQSLKVEIQGHTDATGTKEYNQSLSEKRAQSVMQYLVGKRIAASRLTARGYGFEKPVATNDTEEGRRQNRRTTILILETR